MKAARLFKRQSIAQLSARCCKFSQTNQRQSDVASEIIELIEITPNGLSRQFPTSNYIGATDSWIHSLPANNAGSVVQYIFVCNYFISCMWCVLVRNDLNYLRCNAYIESSVRHEWTTVLSAGVMVIVSLGVAVGVTVGILMLVLVLVYQRRFVRSLLFCLIDCSSTLGGNSILYHGNTWTACRLVLVACSARITVLWSAARVENHEWFVFEWSQAMATCWYSS